VSKIAPDRTVGMRLKIAPSSDAVTDPWWIIITEITDEGVSFTDDDGLVESMDTETWANELEPRVLEVELPQQTEDLPDPAGVPVEEDENEGWIEPDEQPEEPESVPGEEEYAPPAEQSEPELGVGDCAVMEAFDPAAVKSENTLMELADLLNIRDELWAGLRNTEQALANVAGEIDALLKKIAKDRLLATVADEIPFGKPKPGYVVRNEQQNAIAEKTAAPDPMATALGEEIEARNPSEPDPEPPTQQETALAEQVGAAEANEGYATVSRLEMNRRLIEVVGITKGQSERMAEQGVKTLGQFQQRFEETQDGKHNWFDGMKFISAEKADKIEECIERHWVKFKAKHGRK